MIDSMLAAFWIKSTASVVPIWPKPQANQT
jgi:hypothetical protein